MEPPPAFRFPSREPGPLLPLSPERVNGRPISTTSTTGSISTKLSSDNNSQYQPSFSAHSSPTRRANLFADYNPLTTPTKSTASTFGAGLPQSPSLPEIHALRALHGRTNSDVQGLVKRFEHLDVRDKDAESADRRKKHEAELRRAQIGREEAESECRKFREESRRLRKERDEALQDRERVGKRLEAVLEDYRLAKEGEVGKVAVYEKEMRRVRKEAFKASSQVLKLQEELKSTRNSLRITQSGFDLTKEKLRHREEQAFEAQERLAATLEELEKLRQAMQIIGNERDALKTTLREEEVARIAAEGMIALPNTQEDDEDWLGATSPKKHQQKRALSPLSDDKENANVVTKKMVQTRQLEEQLARERMHREHAEEMADFLRMECTFRCCACRTHELSVKLDAAMAEQVERMRNDVKSALSPPAIAHSDEDMDVDGKDDAHETELDEAAEVKTDAEAEGRDTAAATRVQDAPEEADRSMTLAPEEDPELLQPAHEPRADDLPEQEVLQAPHPTPQPVETQYEPARYEPEAMDEDPTTKVPLRSSPLSTPTQAHTEVTPFRLIRTVTTTTTVPMQFTPVAKPRLLPEDTENEPPSTSINSLTGGTDEVPATPAFDRAAALAAIEYRRGRAKSLANGHLTPRKQMLEGVKERRDISAPALGGKGGSGASASFAKGGGSVGRAGGRR